MFRGHPLVPSDQADIVLRDRVRAEFVLHTPRRNDILAALPPDEYDRLLPNLEPFSLPLGWTIHRAGDHHKYLYFITDGIVSRFHTTADGMSSELSATGSEGIVGIALFLGGQSTLSEALVVSTGYAYRLRAGALQAEIARRGALPHLLLRYIQALMTQTEQIATCNRRHTLRQQFTRWILSCLDRLRANELTVTHELIAHVLGVRRESITEAAGKLQQEGLIHLSRGHIVVLDRARLEAQACECHAAVRREYHRLLSAQGSIRGAGPSAYMAPVASGVMSYPGLLANR